jgi:hypothetical protein
MEIKDQNQAETMRQHLAAHKISGQTVRDYCSGHQLKVHQYYYWQNKLQPEAAGKFISISPAFSDAAVTITFTNGNKICFSGMPPVEYVKQLMG